MDLRNLDRGPFLLGQWLNLKGIWKSLKEAFAQDTKDRERSLITRLHTCKKDSSSISNYIKRLKGICDELAAIQKPISADDKIKEQGMEKILTTGAKRVTCIRWIYLA